MAESRTSDTNTPNLLDAENGTVATPKPAAKGGRLDALDALRGFIMIIMAVDHTCDMMGTDGKSGSEKWSGEPAYTPDGGAPVGIHFATRFATDLCAPGFCFLMGVSMSLLQTSREKDGWGHLRILRFHLIRALVLLCPCHVILEKFGFSLPRLVYNMPHTGSVPMPKSVWVFLLSTEMTSIMFSLPVCMAIAAIVAALLAKFGRRVKMSVYSILGLAIFVGAQTYVQYIADPKNQTRDGWFMALLFLPSSPYLGGHLMVLYTVFPLAGLCFFGCAFGVLLQNREHQARLGWISAAIATVLGILFVIVRVCRGFGNSQLGDPSQNPSLIAFFDIVKYPMDIAYSTCTMSINFAFLAAFQFLATWAQPEQPFQHGAWRALLVYGRAPLFYYLAHIWCLSIFRIIVIGKDGWSSFYLIYPVWAGVVVLLYKPCLWYADFKNSKSKTSIWRLF